MPIKCILFDLDGTLIDTMGLLNNLLIKNLENRFSKEKSQNMLFFFADNLGKPWRLWSFNKKYGISLIRYLCALLSSLVVYELKMTNAEHFKDAEKTLNYLKKKYTLILVTNARKKEAMKKLRNLSVYFDDIVTRNIWVPKKPDTKMLRLALNKTDFRPNEVLLVGDSISDYEAANQLGIKSVIVFTGIFSRETMLQKTNANAYIESVSDLPKMSDILNG